MHINEKSRESDAKKQVVTLHASFVTPPRDDEHAHAGLEALITPHRSFVPTSLPPPPPAAAPSTKTGLAQQQNLDRSY
eukprot:COSAG05_NODE_1084_length_5930_cov_11.147316_1_plen_78_part_00